MKARLIETGELIEVKKLYPTIYSRLDKNNKIAEEYYDDEIELIDKPKMVSIEKVCQVLNEMLVEVTYFDKDSIAEHYDKYEFIEDFKKAMEE